MGARFVEEGEQDRLPLRVHGGGLTPLSYRSPVASAQIKSALLLAGLTGKVPVEVIEPLRSRDHSERMLRRMGVEVGEGSVADGWSVRLTPSSAELRPLDLLVPGDFSSAAFLIAFGLLGGAGGELRITNVGLNPTRVGLLDLLREMGGDIQVENLREADSPAGEPAGDLVVRPSELRGGSVGGERIPLMIDEVPILAVLAARVDGVTEIRDAEELRVKESDRIRVLVENLEGLGAKVDELPDGLRIHGNPSLQLTGGIRAHHDHRIAMAFGVLGALPRAEIDVDDRAVADVSFPGFWELLANLAAQRTRGTG
jgi:3-phosphoshikimate 1-carboxyvinyltransferase